MWKLVSKQAMENFFSDEGSSPEKLEIKTISDSEASRIRDHAKESWWNTSRKQIGEVKLEEKSQIFEVSDGTSSMGLTA